VPLLPPELTRPFPTETERAAARRLVIDRDRTLKAIEMLADKPPSAWSPSELSAFPNTTNGVTDPPYRRVARWATLFAEELHELHRLVAGSRPLSDIELQETLYLAGRLLATVTGQPITDVDHFIVQKT
jgi:hypothetical protein